MTGKGSFSHLTTWLAPTVNLRSIHHIEGTTDSQCPMFTYHSGIGETLRTIVAVCFIVFLSQPLAAGSVDDTNGKRPLGDSNVSKNDYEKFQIKLDIEHGHIGHVYIGCQEDASDDFDSRIDDMAPPPGMGGVGYTFLVSPDRKYNLYRDIRGFSDSVQWVFYAKSGTNPVKVSWEKGSIPEGWNLYCSPWDGKSDSVSVTYDCRKKNSVTLNKTGFFRFWVERVKKDKQEDAKSSD